MNTKEIKKLIPEDFRKHVNRDLGIFTSSIFGETYTKTDKELFGINGFSIVLWMVRNRNIMTFYRSEKEQEQFQEEVGKKCKNKEFSSHLAMRLRELSDWFWTFIKDNPTLEQFLENKEEFVKNYRIFFSYHKVIYWASYYLHKNNSELKGILKELDSSYAYNERVVPDVESYLVKLGIDHLHYKDNEGESRDRGMFFLDNGEEIDAFNEELDDLEMFIESKKDIDYNLRELKGIGISKGKVIGTVKVIKDQSKQGEVKEGTILVTGITRPQFNSILKQCKSIITDEGGMLCHTAILCREFNIPSVVDTKIATEIFKDGDEVEVDADNGTVRKLS